MSSLLMFNYTVYRRRFSQSCWYLGKEWHMKALKGGYKVKQLGLLSAAGIKNIQND
jgi:hypothetical protein